MVLLRPNDDTDPHDQRLVIGPYLETGMGPQGLAGVGFCVFKPSMPKRSVLINLIIIYTMKKTIALIIALNLLALPQMTAAKDTWYSTEEKARIDLQFEQMQSQITELNNLTTQLQTKVFQISQQPVVEPQIQQVVETKVVETKEIVRDPDNTKVEALEKRVTTLESAVSFIQTKVMQSITTLIGLIQKLLAR